MMQLLSCPLKPLAVIPVIDHGGVEIDNNLAENSMRPIATGRKNWIHIGSQQAGPRVAAILSVVESCRRLKIPSARLPWRHPARTRQHAAPACRRTYPPPPGRQPPVIVGRVLESYAYDHPIARYHLAFPSIHAQIVPCAGPFQLRRIKVERMDSVATFEELLWGGMDQWAWIDNHATWL